jgi:hypothetical protein
VRIAIAACRSADDAPPTSLYPDADAVLLEPALLAAGASVVRVVSWDDPGVDWASFDAVVVSSTWDSVDRPSEYLGWVADVGAVTSLVNPADVLAWNLDKRYLRDLEDAGLPTVPTTWVAPDDAVPTFPAGRDVVVKPAVSAGGRSTVWHAASSHEAAARHVAALQAEGATAMVQDHVAGVAAVGEVKAVYLDGRYSHATRVGGLLDRDGGILDRPWEKPVPVTPVEASAVERAVGDAVAAELMRRFGSPCAYARIDVVLDAAGAPMILEVELIDPVLRLDLSPAAPATLAAAILSRARTAFAR